MPTSFLINLERHPGRREATLRRFHDVGLKPEWHPAVDGRSHPDAHAHPPLTPGEVGCYLSHLSVLERIVVEPTSDYVLILEDDAVPCEDFGRLLQQALREARARDSGLCQLGWLPKDEELRMTYRCYARMSASKMLRRALYHLGKTPEMQPPLLTARSPSWGTHCYMISRDFAPMFASLLRGSPLAPVDYYLGALAALYPGRVLKARAPLAGQDWSFASSVHANRSRFQHAQISESGKVLRRRFASAIEEEPDE